MNALKNRTFQFASGLLAIGAIGLLTPRVAHAVVATLVQVANTTANPVPNQDVDNSARNFYQSFQTTSSCPNVCAVTFAAVPTGKRLIVQHVSSTLIFFVNGAVPPSRLELTDSRSMTA